MNIKVIGSGCENCDKTNAIVAECVEELGIDAEIERVAAVSYTHLTLPTKA